MADNDFEVESDRTRRAEDGGNPVGSGMPGTPGDNNNPGGNRPDDVEPTENRILRNNNGTIESLTAAAQVDYPNMTRDEVETRQNIQKINAIIIDGDHKGIPVDLSKYNLKDVSPADLGRIAGEIEIDQRAREQQENERRTKQEAEDREAAERRAKEAQELQQGLTQAIIGSASFIADRPLDGAGQTVRPVGITAPSDNSQPLRPGAAGAKAAGAAAGTAAGAAPNDPANGKDKPKGQNEGAVITTSNPIHPKNIPAFGDNPALNNDAVRQSGLAALVAMNAAAAVGGLTGGALFTPAINTGLNTGNAPAPAQQVGTGNNR